MPGDADGYRRCFLDGGVLLQMAGVVRIKKATGEAGAENGEIGNQIMVFVRLRPMSKKEKEGGSRSCVRIMNKKDVYLTEGITVNHRYSIAAKYRGEVPAWEEVRIGAATGSVTASAQKALPSLEGFSPIDGDPRPAPALHPPPRHLDNNDDESTVDCMHEYRHAMPLDNTARSSTPPYTILTPNDVSPIESARARFLQIVVDHFINEHVVEAVGSPDADYGHGHDKLSKRKPPEVHYEGDARFALPLMYVANLYETLVNDVNMRLASLEGIREKTIGVALEASGGLYRKLAKKFPRKGSCSFKRRELATSIETRTRFPELVVQEEKRIRFVVVNGLVIVEKPSSMTVEDAEWFKRLTGRHEVSISARDYKFYTPRHKYRRVGTQSVSNIPGLGAFSGTDSSSPLAGAITFRPVNEQQNQQQPLSKHHMQQLSPQPQFHPLHQAHHQPVRQPVQQNQHATHFPQLHQCTHSSHVADIAPQHQSPSMPQHMTCMQCLPGVHVGGRLHLLPTSLAKFCDECGSPYLRETSKFCSECGTKRLGT